MKKNQLSDDELKWGQSILDAIQRMSNPVKHSYRVALFKFLEDRDHEVKGGNSTYLSKEIKHNEKGPSQIEFLVGPLLETLEKAKLDARDKPILEDIRLSVRRFIESGRINVDISEAFRVMFSAAEIPNLSNADDLVGEYFGYRLSANVGKLIRFYIRIWPSADKSNFLRFENYFIRNEIPWKTTGFGLCIGSTIFYLVGNSVHMDTGSPLGLRNFTLTPYFPLSGWFPGTLSSIVPEDKMPIAAKIVLVPVDRHVVAGNILAGLGDDPAKRMVAIRELIHDDVIADGLDEEIVHPTPEKNIFATKTIDPKVKHELPTIRHRASDYIHFLVRNWTLTTLQVRQDDLPSNPVEMEELRRVWDNEERFAERWSKKRKEEVLFEYAHSLESLMEKVFLENE